MLMKHLSEMKKLVSGHIPPPPTRTRSNLASSPVRSPTLPTNSYTRRPVTSAEFRQKLSRWSNTEHEIFRKNGHGRISPYQSYSKLLLEHFLSKTCVLIMFLIKKSIADVFAGGGVTSLPGHLRVCGVSVGGFRCNSDCNEKNTMTKQLIVH